MAIDAQEAYASILLFLLRQLLVSPAYIHVITDGNTDHENNHYIPCTDGHKYSIHYFRKKDKAILTTALNARINIMNWLYRLVNIR